MSNFSSKQQTVGRANRAIKNIALATFLLVAMQGALRAQADIYTRPAWWFGAAAASNFNFYKGTTQQLSDDFATPTAFKKGQGNGLYAAPLMEYRDPNSMFGFMLQSGYDSRSGDFDQVTSELKRPTDLSTKLTYVTVEPSLRFSPYHSIFYLFAGPRASFNVDKSYTYKSSTSPGFPEKLADVKGDFSKVRKTQVSMQAGLGFDIPLSTEFSRVQYMLSPFVSYQPYLGQAPRSVESWDIDAFRVGLAVKMGRRKKILMPSPAVIELPLPNDPIVSFSVNAPRNIPKTRRVREFFRLRNYVFFDLGSTEIPGRYELLAKNEVKDFKEDQLQDYALKSLTGRSAREMVVYYNILNILGDRMQKNPTATINLVGSSEKGPEDGRAMAGSIKKYLTEIFSINADRIGIEGRDKPKIPSEKPGATVDLELLREGDRRVSIESSSPVLLMEFRSGPNTPLMAVEINSVQDAPYDSYVSFNVAGANAGFSSWNLEIRDEKGQLQRFGPFTQERVSIPGKTILGDRLEGNYQVAMIGKTFSGKTVRKETPVNMMLWTPPEDERGIRYSVLFEFDESKAITLYEKYLTEIVVPKIPKGGTVIISGHTDIIGNAGYNETLSAARANEVLSILQSALAKQGRTDVGFELYGFGEDEAVSPFENHFPEERFYNRTVIIDIISKK